MQQNGMLKLACICLTCCLASLGNYINCRSMKIHELHHSKFTELYEHLNILLFIFKYIMWRHRKPQINLSCNTAQRQQKCSLIWHRYTLFYAIYQVMFPYHLSRGLVWTF